MIIDHSSLSRGAGNASGSSILILYAWIIVNDA